MATHFHTIPRRLLGLGLTAVALVLTPAAAHAANANAGSGKLTYTGTSYEANRLVATYNGNGSVTLTESGQAGPYPVLISTDGSCHGFGRTVTCSSVAWLEVKTSDGGDYVDTTAVPLSTVVVTGNGHDRVYTGGAADNVNAGDGDDTIDGGSGSDTIDGGAGDDRLMMRDATADQLACGAGADSGDADQEDSVDPDCEDVVRAEAGAATEEQPPPLAPDPPSDEPRPTIFNLAAPVIPPQEATVTASGVALVLIACPVNAGACKGTIELQLLGDDGGARGKVTAARRRKPRTVGRARFKAAAGTKPIVRVQLERRGRRRVLRNGSKRCRIVLTTRTAAGKVLRTSRDITLRARRSARPQRGGKKH